MVNGPVATVTVHQAQVVEGVVVVVPVVMMHFYHVLWREAQSTVSVYVLMETSHPRGYTVVKDRSGLVSIAHQAHADSLMKLKKITR
jgi:hypothetical protein